MHTDQVAILRERIAELARIRQGFSAHLGSSLYEATKDDEQLRWGRESLYDGIAMCDAERTRLLERIEKLGREELGAQSESVPETDVSGSFAVEQEMAAMTEEEPSAGQKLPADVDQLSPWGEPTFFTPDETEGDEAAEKVEPQVEIEGFRVSGNGMELSAPEEEIESLLSSPQVETSAETLSHEIDPNQPTCPVCGARVSETDVFCLNCGRSLMQAPVTMPNDVVAEAPQNEEKRTCPVCGGSVEADNKFCMTCGAALVEATKDDAPEPQPAPQSEPMVCPECGKPIDPSFKFCMSCGHKL